MHKPTRQPSKGRESAAAEAQAPKVDLRTKAVFDAYYSGGMKAMQRRLGPALYRKLAAIPADSSQTGLDKLASITLRNETQQKSRLRVSVSLLKGSHADRSTRGREHELLDHLTEFDSVFHVLQKFTVKMGHANNWFRAVEAGKFLYRGGRQKAEKRGEQRAEALREESPKPKKGAGTTVVANRSDYARKLLETYVVYSEGNPGQLFMCSRASLIKIFAPNPLKVAQLAPEESERRVRTRMSRGAKETAETGGLEEILQAAADVLDSDALPFLPEEQKEKVELRKRVRDLELVISMLLASPVGTAQARTLALAPDRHIRMLEGWCRDRKDVLPAGAQLMFDRLQDGASDLSEAQTKGIYCLLFALQAAETCLDKRSVLNAFQSDLDELEQMSDAARPKSAALLVSESSTLDLVLEATRKEIAELLEDPREFLALDTFTKLLGRRPLHQIRIDANRIVHTGDQAELAEAFELFCPLFFTEDGSWKPEAIQESVPMALLNRSIYRAKVSQEGSASPKPVLSRDDFYAVQCLFFFEWISKGSMEKFFSQVPIKDFREMVDGAIVAKRKAVALHQAIDAADASGELSASTKIDRAEVGTALVHWSAPLVDGRAVRAERFELPGYSVPFAEIPGRLRAAAHALKQVGDVTRFRRRMEREVRAGVCTEQAWKKLTLEGNPEQIAAAVRKADLTAELAAIKEMQRSPFVTLPGLWLIEHEHHEILRADTGAKIRELAAFKTKFDELNLGDDAVISEWSEFAADYVNAWSLTGRVGDRQLELTFNYLAPPTMEHIVKLERGTDRRFDVIRYITPDEARAYMQKQQGEQVAGLRPALPEDLQLLFRFFDFSSASSLPPGMQTSRNTAVWKFLRDALRSTHYTKYLVPVELMKQVQAHFEGSKTGEA